MTVSNANIASVIGRIRKKVREFKEPAVTLVAKHHKSPYHVLVATLISLRTKDEVTAQAATRLFALAQTPQAMVKLSPERIAQAIYPAGFYKTKGRVIRNVSAILLNDYDGEVPDEIDELVKLPGVGRKTANLVVTEGYGKLGICVDTHVHRISNRFGYVKTKSPEETESALRAKLPQKYWIEYNFLLVAFGQNHCSPVSPRCSTCPVAKECARRGVAQSR